MTSIGVCSKSRVVSYNIICSFLS